MHLKMPLRTRRRWHWRKLKQWGMFVMFRLDKTRRFIDCILLVFLLKLIKHLTIRLNTTNAAGLSMDHYPFTCSSCTYYYLLRKKIRLLSAAVVAGVWAEIALKLRPGSSSIRTITTSLASRLIIMIPCIDEGSGDFSDRPVSVVHDNFAAPPAPWSGRSKWPHATCPSRSSDDLVTADIAIAWNERYCHTFYADITMVTLLRSSINDTLKV